MKEKIFNLHLHTRLLACLLSLNVFAEEEVEQVWECQAQCIGVFDLNRSAQVIMGPMLSEKWWTRRMAFRAMETQCKNLMGSSTALLIKNFSRSYSYDEKESNSSSRSYAYALSNVYITEQWGESTSHFQSRSEAVDFSYNPAFQADPHICDKIDYDPNLIDADESIGG